jgi:hypothetical protein
MVDVQHPIYLAYMNTRIPNPESRFLQSPRVALIFFPRAHPLLHTPLVYSISDINYW